VSTYRAILLATGATYDYQADAPVAWAGMSPPEQHEPVSGTGSEAATSYVPIYIKSQAFRDRFPIQYRIGITYAAMQQTTFGAAIKTLMDDMTVHPRIDLALRTPESAFAGMAMLVQCGLLPQDVMDSAMNPVMAAVEVWQE